ncbi:hypothetical protein EGW08_016870, partial [Elysia chlorotica]
TFLDRLPELVLVGALLKRVRQAHVARTHVPEQDAERVDIHAVVIVTSKQLRRHVDGRAHDAAAHHRLRLAEAQVRDAAPVPLCDLNSYQNILQFDVSVHQALTVEIPQPLHHVDRHLNPLPASPAEPVEPLLDGGVEVPLEPVHDEQDGRRRPSPVHVVDDRAPQHHYTRVFRDV